MLKRKLRDQSGNALITVILICLVLSIILAGLSRETTSNTQVNQANMEADQAYLAARSAIEMLKQAGQDPDNAELIRDASYTPTELNSGASDKDLQIDFGHMGGATVKVVQQTIKKTQYDPTGAVVLVGGVPQIREEVDEHKVLLVSRGYCNGKSYVISRKIDLVGDEVPPPPDGKFIFRSKAYTKFGSSETVLGSGVQGDVMIASPNGKVTLCGAYADHPIGNLVAVGNLDCKQKAGDTGTVRCKLIATGGHLDLSTCAHPIVDGDILVGLQKNIGDSTYDPWFACTQLDCKGHLFVEGEIKELKNSRIGNPTINDYYSEVVVKCGGDFTSSADGDTKINIYGSLVVGGDAVIRATNVYGDVICYGDVTIDPDVAIYGNVYAGGKVDLKENGAFPLVYDTAKIYAGGELKAVSQNTPSKTTAYAARFSGYGNLVLSSSASSTAYKGVLYNYNESNANASTLKTKLNQEFTGADFVGADKYIQNEVLSTPIPTVKIPSTLATAPKVYMSQMNNEDDTGAIEIKNDCILVGDGNVHGDWHTNQFIYVNASENDIDILIQGDESNTAQGDLGFAGNGSFVINDGGGAHKVRIFMTGNTAIRAQNWATSLFLPISDSYPNATLEELVAAGSNKFGTYLDITKIPRFYILSDYVMSDTGDANRPLLELNGTGYVPGYIIAPGIKITLGAGRSPVCGDKVDTDGSYVKVTDMSFWKQEGGNVPAIHGLLVCDDMDFGGFVGSAIWYDERVGDEVNKPQRYYDFTTDLADVVVYE